MRSFRTLSPILALACLALGGQTEPEPIPEWLLDPNDPRFDPKEALRRLHEGARPAEPDMTMVEYRRHLEELDRQDRERVPVVMEAERTAMLRELLAREDLRPVVIDLTHDGIGRGFRPNELVDLNARLETLGEGLIPPNVSMELSLPDLLARLEGMHPGSLPRVHHTMEGIRRFREAQAAREPEPEPAPPPEVNWRDREWRPIEEPKERFCAAMGFPQSRGLYLNHLMPVAEALIKRTRKAVHRSGRDFDEAFNEQIELRRAALQPKPGATRNALPCMICGGDHR